MLEPRYDRFIIPHDISRRIDIHHTEDDDVLPCPLQYVHEGLNHIIDADGGQDHDEKDRSQGESEIIEIDLHILSGDVRYHADDLSGHPHQYDIEGFHDLETEGIDDDSANETLQDIHDLEPLPIGMFQHHLEQHAHHREADQGESDRLKEGEDRFDD